MKFISGILLLVMSLIFILASSVLAEVIEPCESGDICVSSAWYNDNQSFCSNGNNRNCSAVYTGEDVCCDGCEVTCKQMYKDAPATSERATLIQKCLDNCHAAPFLSLGDVGYTIETIANWLEGIAATIGVLMIIIGGIMYMTAAGSEEKAGKAKKILLYGIIGIAIALIAWGIESLLLSFFF